MGRGKQIIFLCNHCCKEFKRYPCKIKSPLVYCSYECYYGYMRKHRILRQDRRVMWRIPNGERNYAHRIIASEILGKPLPHKVVIHHYGPLNDPKKIVICETNGYHLLLHARKRIVDAGGNPNVDKICGGCKEL